MSAMRSWISVRSRCITAALLALAASVVFSWAAEPAYSAFIITSSHILPVPDGNTVGSGNGTLDFILLTESAGGTENSGGSFDGDDSNTQMPTGSGNTTADESFITSIGEIRAFYRLNFPNGSGGSTVNHLTLFVDVNETGGPETISLDTLEIIRDYTANFGDDRDDPANTDIDSSRQNLTNAGFTGGTLLAQLDSAKTLDQVNVGAGHADQAIFTGINPFSPAFSDSTRILFHWASSDHSDGGETIFLSGDIAPQDVPESGPILPEPSSIVLLTVGMAAVCIGVARQRRID